MELNNVERVIMEKDALENMAHPFITQLFATFKNNTYPCTATEIETAAGYLLSYSEFF